MSESCKKTKDVTIAKAKGRPMLTWVGKKPLSRVTAYPAQAIERFEATGENRGQRKREVRVSHPQVTLCR